MDPAGPASQAGAPKRGSTRLTAVTPQGEGCGKPATFGLKADGIGMLWCLPTRARLPCAGRVVGTAAAARRWCDGCIVASVLNFGDTGSRLLVRTPAQSGRAGNNLSPGWRPRWRLRAERACGTR